LLLSRIKYIIVLMIMCCGFHGHATTLPTMTLDTDGGLPQTHIYRIIQDSRGFLWLCTGEGAVRYDGEQIKIYNLNHGYPFSLVNRILEVRPGVVWIADYAEGLLALEDDIPRKIEIAGFNSESHVTDFAIGPSGEVVVVTNADGGFHIIKEDESIHWDRSKVPIITDIYRVAVDGQGKIYLGSNSSGLMIFNNDRIEEHYTEENILPDNDVLAILPVSEQEVWVGTLKGLVILGNKELSDRFNREFNSCPVLNVFRENAESYWISAIGGDRALIHYDGTDFTPITSLFEEGATDRSDCVWIDQYGTIFIGSPTGLVTVTDRNFTNYGFKDGLKDTYIKGIAEDSEGRIWVGTRLRGLYYLKDHHFFEQNYLKQVSHDSHIIFVKSVGNQIWAGTMNGLIIIEDHEQIQNELTSLLTGQMVRHVGVFRDGSITISCQKKIFLMNESGIEEITYNLKDLDISIWGTEQDNNMAVIAVSNRHGLWKLGDKQWIPIKLEQKNLEINPPIIGMSKAPDGQLLLPTRKGGFRWDGLRLEKIFDRGKAVWCMIQSPDGALWVSTSEGLYKKTKSSLNCYDQTMGLITSEFNMQSSLIDSRGDYWFGGIKGLVQYRENTEIAEPDVHQVYITEVVASGETLHFPGREKVFRYDQSDLTFRYVSPSYKFGSRVSYRYKLEGHDEEFRAGEKGNAINYTNLDYGDYRFLVQSKLEYGEWGSYQAVFPFSIQTPWWSTKLAYVLYTLIGIGLLVIAVKWRVRLLKARNKTLEQLVESKLLALRQSNDQLEGEVRERKAAEFALEKEKENLEVTLKFLQDGVVKTNSHGVIEFINSVGLDLLGIKESDALGKDFSEVIRLIDPKTEEKVTFPFNSYFQELIEEPEKRLKLILHTTEEDLLVNLTGSPVLDRDSEPVGMVYLIRDIELEQRVDEELFKVQKLDSVGLLAGGIAHDFNNILSGILGNTQLAMLAESRGKGCNRYLQGIEKATLSAKTLSQQLLTFSKGGEPVKTNLNLTKELRNTVEFYLRGKQVKAEFQMAPDLWSIHADRGQIHQVLNNLIINACEAMPRKGTLKVRAHNLEFTVHNQYHLKAGNYIKISLTDTGCGIPKGVLTKIFDPFFSTKSTGSGLGLATSYAIIEKHAGMITAQSTEGRGATFDIYLPAVLVQQDEETESSDFQVFPAKILFMDDDQTILEFVKEVFELFGYDAVLTENGTQTIHQFKQALEMKRPFDLVILDWTIPGAMGGEETIRQLIELDPHIKAIVSSGYSNQGALTKFREYGFVGILPKPYKIEELRKKISTYLKT